MDLRIFFNFVLLSLSLATLIITLFSYLIYKLRQAGAFRAAQQSQVLEGAFFRRYAPHHLPKEVASNGAQPKIAPKKGLKRMASVGALYGIAAVVILTSLIVERYLAERSDSLERKTSSDALLDLAKKGMMRRYDFSSRLSAADLNQETLWASERSQLLVAKNLSQGHRIGIYGGPLKKGRSIESTGKASSAWLSFLNRMELAHEVLSKLDTQACELDLLIVTSDTLLSTSDLKALRGCENRPPSLLAVGALGLDQPTVDLEVQDWFEKTFQVKIQPQPKGEQNFPSRVSSQRGEAPWGIPNGYLMEWYPESEKYLGASLENGGAWICEANHRGRTRTIGVGGSELPIVRLKVTLQSRVPAAWTNLLPSEELLSRGAPERRDLVWLTVVSHLMGNPQLHLETWPRGQRGGVAFVVEAPAETDPQDLSTLLDNLGGLPSGATWVWERAPAESLRKIFARAPLGFDMALSGQPFQNVTDAEAGFDGVETSRLRLEGALGWPVLGFFADTAPGAALVGAIRQNRLSWIFSKRKPKAVEPLALGNGDLISLSEMSLIQMESNENPHLLGAESWIEGVKQILNDSTTDSALTVFSASLSGWRKNLSKKEWRLVGNLVKEQGLWLTSLAQLAKWALVRGNLGVEIQEVPPDKMEPALARQWNVIVKNPTTETLSEASLELTTQNCGSWGVRGLEGSPISLRKPSSTSTICPMIDLPMLSPKSQVTFQIFQRRSQP